MKSSFVGSRNDSFPDWYCGKRFRRRMTELVVDGFGHGVYSLLGLGKGEDPTRR
jgi:hypothetical protein